MSRSISFWGEEDESVDLFIKIDVALESEKEIEKFIDALEDTVRKFCELEDYYIDWEAL